jgi:arylsulfatase A-like enzyme
MRKRFGSLRFFTYRAIPWIALTAVSGARAVEPPKPNIIIILADDLGYAGLGCQGSTDIPTPNIDSIALNGVRFTDGYVTFPVCSPSRAGLMSGRYQQRFGFEANSGPEAYAAENFGLPRSELTLAEKLKGAGYVTGMAGKWHIGFKEGLRPPERGFDSFFGFLAGANNYLAEHRKRGEILRGTEPVDEKEYLTAAFARETVDFIRANKERPFFFYLAFNAVHSPLEAEKEYEARFAHITDPKRRTYAAMTAAMDDAVGRVLAALRENGLESNTLIFFLSDNGGPTEQTTSSNAPLRGYKGQLFEGGIRIPFLAQWKGRLPAGTVYTRPVISLDIHATATALAGIPPSAEKPLDGVNLMPFLTSDNAGQPHDILLWRDKGKKAVRMGDWKLVQERTGGPQLYNLRDDIGETRDLAQADPERFKELSSAWDDWNRQLMDPLWKRQDSKTGKAASGETKAVPLNDRFRQMDRNNDNLLTRNEVPGDALFNRMDEDKNGEVTLDEAVRSFKRTK